MFTNVSSKQVDLRLDTLAKNLLNENYSWNPKVSRSKPKVLMKNHSQKLSNFCFMSCNIPYVFHLSAESSGCHWHAIRWTSLPQHLHLAQFSMQLLIKLRRWDWWQQGASSPVCSAQLTGVLLTGIVLVLLNRTDWWLWKLTLEYLDFFQLIPASLYCNKVPWVFRRVPRTLECFLRLPDNSPGFHMWSNSAMNNLNSWLLFFFWKQLHTLFLRRWEKGQGQSIGNFKFVRLMVTWQCDSYSPILGRIWNETWKTWREDVQVPLSRRKIFDI